MARNVEIKARANDFQAQMRVAENISSHVPETIYQEDVFFNVPSGRLKLRIFSKERAQLIFYTRPDQQGPKISNYEISASSDPAGLKSVLDAAYGTRATVTKSRHLFMCGRTRIHFDEVNLLGEFIELEVVLSEDEDEDEDEDVASGEAEARHLMKTLGIEEDHLIEEAYVDMLQQSAT